MEMNTETKATAPSKRAKAAIRQTQQKRTRWVEIVPGPADFAPGYAVPDALNHGDVFAASTLAKSFFETSFSIVNDYGESVDWRSFGRAQAAATLANACAVVYATQMADRQRKPKKTAP